MVRLNTCTWIILQVNLSNLLQSDESKDKIEKHLMDMMAENPMEAAHTLAGLFAHENEVRPTTILWPIL